MMFDLEWISIFGHIFSFIRSLSLSFFCIIFVLCAAILFWLLPKRTFFSYVQTIVNGRKLLARITFMIIIRINESTISDFHNSLFLAYNICIYLGRLLNESDVFMSSIVFLSISFSLSLVKLSSCTTHVLSTDI